MSRFEDSPRRPTPYRDIRSAGRRAVCEFRSDGSTKPCAAVSGYKESANEGGYQLLSVECGRRSQAFIEANKGYRGELSLGDRGKLHLSRWAILSKPFSTAKTILRSSTWSAVSSSIPQRLYDVFMMAEHANSGLERGSGFSARQVAERGRVGIRAYLSVRAGDRRPGAQTQTRECRACASMHCSPRKLDNSSKISAIISRFDLTQALATSSTRRVESSIDCATCPENIYES
jgi:hypothetical protein